MLVYKERIRKLIYAEVDSFPSSVLPRLQRHTLLMLTTGLLVNQIRLYKDIDVYYSIFTDHYTASKKRTEKWL